MPWNRPLSENRALPEWFRADGWRHAVAGTLVAVAVTLALVVGSVGELTVENCLRASLPLSPVFVGGLVAGLVYEGPATRSSVGFRVGVLYGLPVLGLGVVVFRQSLASPGSLLFRALAVLLIAVLLTVLVGLVGLVGKLGGATGDWLRTKFAAHHRLSAGS